MADMCADSETKCACVQSLEAVTAAQSSLAAKGKPLPDGFVRMQHMRPARDRSA